jgi:diacylglycerol kinase (ATP)
MQAIFYGTVHAPEDPVKARLFVNPVSGLDAAPDYLPVINARLRDRVGALDIVMTVGEGDATAMAAQAVRDGYDHLFVAGGDGTLNEVLNGVTSVTDGLAQVVLGIIPLGTGNDLATALGFSSDIDEALDLLLTSTPMLVDVGMLNGRAFLNVSGGGFIAEVSDAVNTQLKSVAGKLAYLIGGAQVLLTHEPIATQVRWHDGSQSHTASFDLEAFAVCNSRQIGGGRLIAPAAVLDDGLLDVCLIESMPTVEFIALLRRVSSGDHMDDARVHYFRASSVGMTFDRVIKVNIDGQVLEASACEYRVLHRAARLLGPFRSDAAVPTRRDDSVR